MKPSQTSNGKYRLGIAMTGGGARGFAHAGALKAIEEAGLRPDIVAGVSAGSIVAAFYAAGRCPDEMLELFNHRGLLDFVNIRPGGGGIFSVRPFKSFIRKAVAPYVNLEDLPMPTYLGVTDFDRGLATEFHSGEISERVIASCSIPIVFRPVNIGGINYVDGGVLRNHPAWIIRDKCEYLIGINVSPLHNGLKCDSLVSVAMRTYNLMAKANQQQDMALCDLNIEARDISHYRTFDLSSIKNVFMSGYVNTRKALRDAGLWQTAPYDNK